MISPENQNSAGGADNASYNVSCFDDSYASDDDLSVEQSTHVNKRQKMTEEERLTRWYVTKSMSIKPTNHSEHGTRFDLNHLIHKIITVVNAIEFMPVTHGRERSRKWTVFKVVYKNLLTRYNEQN